MPNLPERPPTAPRKTPRRSASPSSTTEAIRRTRWISARSFAPFGPALNNIVIMESFVPSFDFPGLQDFLAKYRAKAARQQIDPFGYGFSPFGYAAGQILGQAVNATQSLDHDRIAQYIHATTFSTVAGDIAFGKDGEWTKPRTVFSQFQDVQPSNVDQFRDGSRQPILWPSEFRKGTMVYPYAEATR